jgi:hypothetical protein
MATPSFSLTYLSFHEISRAHQQHLLRQMMESFEKPWADPTYLLHRLLRPSCRLFLWREDTPNEPAKGVAFVWKESAFLYLDKFFVITEYKQQRIGYPFLTALLSSLSVSPSLPLLWRTDAILATRFYGKHPSVQTIGTCDEYVYQLASTPRRPWEYEDIAPLLLRGSAFQNAT